MNIFALARDTVVAAQLHVDKHVVKMPLETAQMLCTVNHLYGKHDVPYKATHAKHPCTIWASQSVCNYKWLVDLGRQLCAEYEYRYGRQHKCLDVINAVAEPPSGVPDGPLTEFATAMPDECKLDDPVDSYRNYYRMKKHGMASWKGRPRPDWMPEQEATNERQSI